MSFNQFIMHHQTAIYQIMGIFFLLVFSRLTLPLAIQLINYAMFWFENKKRLKTDEENFQEAQTQFDETSTNKHGLNLNDNNSNNCIVKKKKKGSKAEHVSKIPTVTKADELYDEVFPQLDQY